MMTLKVQINTFLISIVFGILFSMFINLVYKEKLINIIFSFFIVVIFSILYFLILLYMNNAIIHPYFILATLIGYFLEKIIKQIIKKICIILKKML